MRHDLDQLVVRADTRLLWNLEFACLAASESHFARLEVAVCAAPLSSVKTLEQFDWNAAGGVPKAQVLKLDHLGFVERAEHSMMLGPSGVGKTNIALALAYRAVMAGRNVHSSRRRT